MKRIISAIKKSVSIPLIALESDKTGEQVIYTFNPISDNGIKKAYNLKLNIVANSLANAETYDLAIRKAILNVGDSCPVDGIQKIELNGGGTLTSVAGVHRITNYTIII